MFCIYVQCPIHGEQYIMFSNSQRSMLCVNCFRDTPADARLHCVDIDTAYAQACKNLERSLVVSTWVSLICYYYGDEIPSILLLAKERVNHRTVWKLLVCKLCCVQSVREIQGLVRTGVVSCRTLLDELHHNTNSEKSTIHSFCQGMQDAIAKTQAAMLLEVQRYKLLICLS